LRRSRCGYLRRSRCECGGAAAAICGGAAASANSDVKRAIQCRLGTKGAPRHWPYSSCPNDVGGGTSSFEKQKTKTIPPCLALPDNGPAPAVRGPFSDIKARGGARSAPPPGGARGSGARGAEPRVPPGDGPHRTRPRAARRRGASRPVSHIDHVPAGTNGSKISQIT